MKAKALLFGLNYGHTTDAKLSGCINDVRNIADYLATKLSIPSMAYTDDVDLANTSGMGIMIKLYEMAVMSYQENLDLVWIHYSGHGSYIADSSSDERDGRDECLVPSDYQTKGLIPDDYINSLLGMFNPNTRVICIFDCCHSGTIGDVKYSWEGPKKVVVENIMCAVKCKAITISGCLDTQVSMDAFNVSGDNKYTGALTSCLLMVLRQDPSVISNVFTVITRLRSKLAEKGFKQTAKLCSTHNLAKDVVFVPVL
jgi:hypothetical protein